MSVHEFAANNTIGPGWLQLGTVDKVLLRSTM